MGYPPVARCTCCDRYTYNDLLTSKLCPYCRNGRFIRYSDPGDWAECSACAGTGDSLKGWRTCLPCQGTGWQATAPHEL